MELSGFESLSSKAEGELLEHFRLERDIVRVAF